MIGRKLLSSFHILQFAAAVPKVADQISMSVEPPTAAVDDDVKIKCAHNISRVIDYYPRIAVNSWIYTVDTLTRSEKYNLTNSTFINGVAVLVLTLHNVGMTDNGTIFQCYFRLNGGMEIRSNVAALMVHNRGMMYILPCIINAYHIYIYIAIYHDQCLVYGIAKQHLKVKIVYR